MSILIAEPAPVHVPNFRHSGAWLLGHALGLHSEISEPPAGYSEAEAEAFRHGWEFGRANRGPEECPDWIGEYLADLHGDDFDQQPDPDDLDLWTISESEWREVAEGFTRSPDELIHDAERDRVMGHRATSFDEGRTA